MIKALLAALGLLLAGVGSYSQAGPSNVLATAASPSVAAYSLCRRMAAGYTGSLFQIQRASDSATLNVGTLPSGIVDAAAIDSFTAGTTWTYLIYFDQMGTPATGNNLPVDGAFGKLPTPGGWTTFPNGLRCPVARIVPGEGYYQGTCCNGGGTVGIPTGNAAITVAMLVENVNTGTPIDGCCGQRSDSESPTMGGPKGHMFGTAYSTGGMGTSCIGPGPCPGVDLELGVYLYGAAPTETYLSILAKYDPTGPSMAVKSGDATQGPLATLYAGALPAGYVMDLEGGVSLGRGGDGSNAPVNFVEGWISAWATTDVTDLAVEANVTAFYGLPSTGTEIITVLDPSCVTAAPCTLELYRAALGAGQAACPAAGDPSYAALATSLPGSVVGPASTAWAYSDTAVAPGTVYCYYGTVSFVSGGPASSPSPVFQAAIAAP